MAAAFPAARKALLVVDLQREFLDPAVGRCLLPRLAPAPECGPRFLANLRRLLPEFRDAPGHVIWVRSESNGRRDFTDPRVEETIRIVNSDDEDSELSDSDGEPAAAGTSAAEGGGKQPGGAKLRRSRSVKSGKLDGKGPPRPPLLTDAFLSIETKFPPVAPCSPAAEWHPSIAPLITPPDDTITKSWYSAFKDTKLLDTLRGRFVTQLYLCGLMTNVSILATAADAVRHGLEVWVLEDCLGYRSPTAHILALNQMEDDFAVKFTTCSELVDSWKGPRDETACRNVVPPLGISHEDLAKMVEGLKVNSKEKGKERRKDKDKDKSSGRSSGRRARNADGLGQNPTAVSSAPALKSAGRPKTEPAQRSKSTPARHPGVDITPGDATKARPEAVAATRPRNDSPPEPISASPPAAPAMAPAKPPIDTTVRAPESAMSPAKSSRKKKVPTSPTKLPAAQMAPTTGPAPPKERAPRHYDSKAPVMGENDAIGEGDSFLVNNILPNELASTVFATLKSEVAWRSMFHRGGEVPRLVAVQGAIDEDGSFPIYRHPADESPPLLPFSPTVDRIRQHVEKVLEHPINHVLIQHYRDGSDYISEHSDKTLDIARGSKIVNVSLGAQRVMVLRTKKDASPKAPPLSPSEGPSTQRTSQRIPLPHNSMFVLGLATNRKWLHGIRQDRRAAVEKTQDELSFNGERISLTFRHIATFLSADERSIYGQGATSKLKPTSPEEERAVINGPCPAAEKMLAGFGAENHRSDFDWDAYYGEGFDVLHMNTPKPKLLVRDYADEHGSEGAEGGKGEGERQRMRERIDHLRLKLCLLEKKIHFEEERIGPSHAAALRVMSPRGTTPVFVDTDRARTTLTDPLAIMGYVEMFLRSEPSEASSNIPPPSSTSAAADGDPSRVSREAQAAEGEDEAATEPDTDADADADADEDAVWLLPSPRDERNAYGVACNRLQESQALLATFLATLSPAPPSACSVSAHAELETELDLWESYLRPGAEFVVGEQVTLADVALFPVVRAIFEGRKERREKTKQEEKEVDEGRWTKLRTWMERMEQRDSVRKAYGLTLSQ